MCGLYGMVHPRFRALLGPVLGVDVVIYERRRIGPSTQSGFEPDSVDTLNIALIIGHQPC